ncbi:MAG: hypothetical protein EHM79_00560 [Geobacter sp.]|nr:MAG: hypothetical protein EHM79_00560 [Geobacter sp.]
MEGVLALLGDPERVFVAEHTDADETLLDSVSRRSTAKICVNPRKSAAVFDSEHRFSPAPTFCNQFSFKGSGEGLPQSLDSGDQIDPRGLVSDGPDQLLLAGGRSDPYGVAKSGVEKTRGRAHLRQALACGSRVLVMRRSTA